MHNRLNILVLIFAVLCGEGFTGSASLKDPIVVGDHANPDPIVIGCSARQDSMAHKSTTTPVRTMNIKSFDGEGQTSIYSLPLETMGIISELNRRRADRGAFDY